MAADVELLPLPEGWRIIRHGHYAESKRQYARAMYEYARANVAHATAPLQAEIEELREALDWTVQQNDELLNEGRELTARAERLAEALREMREYVTAALQAEREAFAGHEDCSDIPGIEADLHKIDAMLREQEEGA